MLAAIADGKVAEATLDSAVGRMLLTRFKHGEFDQSHPWSWITGTEIDTPQVCDLSGPIYHHFRPITESINDLAARVRAWMEHVLPSRAHYGALSCGCSRFRGRFLAYRYRRGHSHARLRASRPCLRSTRAACCRWTSCPMPSPSSAPLATADSATFTATAQRAPMSTRTPRFGIIFLFVFGTGGCFRFPRSHPARALMHCVHKAMMLVVLC